MKTLNLFLKMHFTSLSPDGQAISLAIVSEDLSKFKVGDVISEKNPMYYNYLLIDPSTNNIFYVGKGTKRRCLIHEWNTAHGKSDCNQHKYNKIKKILSLGLHPIIHIVACGISNSESLKNEIELIKFYKRENLTNLSDGGDFNPMDNPETREYIRQYHLGRKRSATSRERMSKSRRLWDITDEHRLNISKSLLDNCRAGKKIKVTNLITGDIKCYDSMLKAELKINIRHETMSKKLKSENGKTIIKKHLIEYNEN